MAGAPAHILYVSTVRREDANIPTRELCLELHAVWQHRLWLVPIAQAAADARVVRVGACVAPSGPEF